MTTVFNNTARSKVLFDLIKMLFLASGLLNQVGRTSLPSNPKLKLKLLASYLIRRPTESFLGEIFK